MDIRKSIRSLMRLNIKVIDYQLNKSYRRNMSQNYEVEGIEFIHALFQELQDQNVDLPMGDYNMIYDILEGIREELYNGNEG